MRTRSLLCAMIGLVFVIVAWRWAVLGGLSGRDRQVGRDWLRAGASVGLLAE
jgi:hypothetical protein